MLERSYGIGGFFKSLARITIPLLKRGAKSVGKKALQVATKCWSKRAGRKSVLKSTKARSGDAVNDITSNRPRTQKKTRSTN